MLRSCGELSVRPLEGWITFDGVDEVARLL
jgi:hypothetical protein